MSQHILRTTTANGQKVEILLGWDRPLQRCFMVVETMEQQDGDEDDYLYDNLSDPAAMEGDPGLDYFRRKLAELEIAAPETLFAEVAKDKANDNGNRVAIHQPDGTFAAR